MMASTPLPLTAIWTEQPSAEWRAARSTAGVGPHLGDPWIAYRIAQGLAPAFITVRGAAGPAGDIAAIGVGWLRRSRLRLWAKPQASFDLLPWWTASARVERAADLAGANTALARAIHELAAKEGWTGLKIDSFDGPVPPPDLAALGAVVHERYEFLLDITVDGEARLAAMKSSHRRKLRDAEKGGVVVADETASADLQLLRELQGHTQERRQDRGEEMELPDSEQYRRLADTFVRGGGGRLLIGRVGGDAVSGILVGVEGKRSYYLMGGTTPRGFECNAAALVLFRAGALLGEAGVALLNLGGVPRTAEVPEDPAHGLFRFKEGFFKEGVTGMRVECRSGAWEP